VFGRGEFYVDPLLAPPALLQGPKGLLNLLIYGGTLFFSQRVCDDSINHRFVYLWHYQVRHIFISIVKASKEPKKFHRATGRLRQEGAMATIYDEYYHWSDVAAADRIYH